MDFTESICQAPVVLTEGAVIERLKRGAQITLDPWILHTGLIYDPAGRQALARIYSGYLQIASASHLPMLTFAPTWRADPKRLRKAGFADAVRANTDAVAFLIEIRRTLPQDSAPVFVGGLMACRGDAYRPQEALDTDSARSLHASQAETLSAAGADFIMAATLPALSEAVGMAQALADTGTPYLISFVTRPDGSLLDSTPMAEAIHCIDNRTSPRPAGFMANCVHPAIFESGYGRMLSDNPGAAARVLGLQANTSALPPDQLDEREELDTMEPEDFARAMAGLHRRYGIKILGGCCGTDTRHIKALAGRITAIYAGGSGTLNGFAPRGS